MDDQADLSHLADIAVPSPIAWWPPAPGWWILAVALMVALAILAGEAIRRYRRNAYRRIALAELAAIRPTNDPAGLMAISAVLKRVALVAYPRIEVASLTGAAWLAFLDRTAGTEAFTKGPAAGLDQAAFAASEAKTEAILAAARRWVTSHRTEA
jgi:hypothetical protein